MSIDCGKHPCLVSRRPFDGHGFLSVGNRIMLAASDIPNRAANDAGDAFPEHIGISH